MVSLQITFQPSGKRLLVEPGHTVLEAAHAAGIQVRAECGGKGLCGKCKVQLSGYEGYTEEEMEFFSQNELRRGFRLACQAIVDKNLTVYIPEESLARKQRILVEGVTRKIILAPNVKKIFLKLPEPSLEDNRTDVERLRDSVEYDIGSVSLEALNQIPGAMRDSRFEVTLILLGDELVGCERGDTSDRCFGVAFDIGTTTVVGYLMDLNTGEQRAVKARMNPQISHGDDVISRINFAQSPENLERLSRSLRDCLMGIITELADAAGVKRGEVYELVVAGNACMQHLLLGISPRSLAVSPYIPVVKESLSISSTLYGKRMYVLPMIAGFVGADTVADVIAYPLDDHLRLLIDIGTNCEVVLGTADRILACSTAAGPAFEGTHIKYGMRAAPGAIERVEINDNVKVYTIDDEPPQGIAGSGLISVTAELLRHGIINRAGKLQTGEKFASWMKNDSFMLNGTISITQKDLREVQLAKGAIFAAQRILLKTYGVTVKDVEEIALAGAFGNYIPKEAAKDIGLIFDLPTEKIKSIGNAAGVGGKLCLLSTREREKAQMISESVEYVELSSRKDFQQEFMDAMFFPHSDLELFPLVRERLARTSTYFKRMSSPIPINE
ncbi:MAG: ASKHA domain-containing protein [Candidatus Methanofastidiosia archaeon]